MVLKGRGKRAVRESRIDMKKDCARLRMPRALSQDTGLRVSCSLDPICHVCTADDHESMLNNVSRYLMINLALNYNMNARNTH
jgi:hypothetical protein